MNEDIEPPIPVFPNYAPPGSVTFADPKQAKPLMKMISKLLRPRPRTHISRVRKGVDSRRRPKDKRVI